LTTTLLPDTLSTVGSWARFLAQGLQECGVDSYQLFLEAGIDLSQSEDPNLRFPVHKMSRVWQLVEEKTGDPCFPLTLAASANPSMYNALGLSMVSSRTVGEAMTRACRFSQVASEGATILLEEREDGDVDLVMRMTDEQRAVVTTQAMEAFMATAAQIFRSISRTDFAPLGVYFSHNRESYRETYERFFQAPLFFDAAEYKIHLPRWALDIKCDQANPELANSIDNWMQDYLARFESDLLSARVRRLLTERLPDGAFRQEEVASALAMSSLSLQRGLQKEGTSFKNLLEVTRQDLGIKYIGEKRLSIIEICCMLGFSDQSNFTKAFKRWTGKTPYSYRQELGI
jgi:AraC-like DNA-binding protein